MKVFAGAGEASGDRILAALLAELKSRIPELELRGFGGPLSEAQGLRSMFSLRDLAVNGLFDVVRRALFLARTYARLRRELLAFRPDLVLLVDYPGMNVGLARLARKRGLPVHFVAPPQLWAYRRPQARRRRLSAALEGASLQFLFPFESHPYTQTPEAPWSGPLAQGHFFAEPAFDPPRGFRLLLCPGSRRGVLTRNLPAWLKTVRIFFGTLDGVDVLVPEFLREDARRLCAALEDSENSGAVILTDKEEAFGRAGAAITFPGTISLELFLRRIPTRAWAIVDAPTLWIGRRSLRGPHLALPNVLAQHEVLPEWVGTASDFRKNPPLLPGQISEWISNDPAGTLALVWERMGSDRGVEVGVNACLKLLQAGFSAE